MDEGCFNCVGPASERYTLVLERSKVLEDKVVCEECLADFRNVECIEIHEEPVSLRGER